MNTQKINTQKIQSNIQPVQASDQTSVSSTPSKKAAGLSRHEKLAIHKKRLRQKQVRRQKLILAVLGAFFLIGIFIVIFFIRQKHPEQLSINSACEAYRSSVENAASQYGMAEYTDLILALMMQESSGQGPDVLQASEGSYNKKYPQVPNGIQDVDYSIECGIQELKYAMDKAGVASPTDMKNIRLALQGYNFGADPYFAYLEKNGIFSWSEASSEAFAQMASGNTPRSEDNPLYATAGPWDYGDQKYPEHVLRYYHP
ncbi:lysozyme family protein [Blautia glucerasea]